MHRFLAIEQPEIPQEVPDIVYQIVGSLIAAGFLIFAWRMLNGVGRTVVIVLLLVAFAIFMYRNS